MENELGCAMDDLPGPLRGMLANLFSVSLRATGVVISARLGSDASRAGWDL